MVQQLKVSLVNKSGLSDDTVFLGFVGGAGCELAEGDEFFGLNELRLKTLEIFYGLLGAGEQARAIFVGNVGAREDDQHQGNRCDQRG